MLKSILNLDGVQKLNKVELKNINGSSQHNADCTCEQIIGHLPCFLNCDEF